MDKSQDTGSCKFECVFCFLKRHSRRGKTSFFCHFRIPTLHQFLQQDIGYNRLHWKVLEIIECLDVISYM